MLQLTDQFDASPDISFLTARQSALQRLHDHTYDRPGPPRVSQAEQINEDENLICLSSKLLLICRSTLQERLPFKLSSGFGLIIHGVFIIALTVMFRFQRR